MTNKKEKKTIESVDEKGFSVETEGELTQTNVNPDETTYSTSDVVPEVPSETESNFEADETIHLESPEIEVKEKQKKKTKVDKLEDEKFEQLVQETINGVHGTGRERMISLGDQYAKVHKEVNRRLFK